LILKTQGLLSNIRVCTDLVASTTDQAERKGKPAADVGRESITGLACIVQIGDYRGSIFF